MPPVDLVVVSHDHYDHLDYPTIRELAKRDVPFVTSLGVGAHLEAWGVRPERIIELDWWESHRLPNTELTVTAAPSQHFSGRGLKDRNATLWSSIVIRSQRHAVFFSGDTGLTTEYADDPRAARAVRSGDAGGRRVPPRLGRHPPRAGERAEGAGAARRRRRSCRCTGARSAWRCTPGTSRPRRCSSWRPKAGAQLVMPRLGEPVEPAHAEGVEPWWRAVDGRRARTPPRPERRRCRRRCPGRSTSAAADLAVGHLAQRVAAVARVGTDLRRPAPRLHRRRPCGAGQHFGALELVDRAVLRLALER